MAIYGSPTVGRLGLLDARSSANQAALGLVADPGVCTTEYLWFVLESLRGHLNQIAQGAAQQNVSKAKVSGCDVLRPPSQVVALFTESAGPAWRNSHKIAHETEVLRTLRDLLLPKLVTGQIDVSSLDLDALFSTGSPDEGAVA
jgi:type I restriction enzyme S subunit